MNEITTIDVEFDPLTVETVETPLIATAIDVHFDLLTVQVVDAPSIVCYHRCDV